jgi:hypothetical protein
MRVLLLVVVMMNISLTAFATEKSSKSTEKVDQKIEKTPEEIDEFVDTIYDAAIGSTLYVAGTAIVQTTLVPLALASAGLATVSAGTVVTAGAGLLTFGTGVAVLVRATDDVVAQAVGEDTGFLQQGAGWLGDKTFIFEGARQVGIGMDEVGITNTYKEIKGSVVDGFENLKVYLAGPEKEVKSEVTTGTATEKES